MHTATAPQRRLILKMSMSLDGFVCGPNGEADWIFRSSGGEDSTAWLLDTLNGAGVHILGSGSYHDMAAFWPFSEMEIAAPMNTIPKVIFSRSGLRHGALGERSKALEEAVARNAERLGAQPSGEVLRSWTEPAVASGDLVEEVRRLKAQPGNYILAHGGARFAQSLVAAGLVDEFRLGIHPVVLGRGQGLFAGLASPLDLRLVSMTTFSSGAAAAVYVPA